MNKLKLVPLLLLGACGFEIVDTGYRGIETRFGQIVGEPLPEGLHFYNPFTSDIKELDVREEKLEGQTQCFTKDTQTVDVKFALTFYPDPKKIGEIYKQFGTDWQDKTLAPAMVGSLKDAIGQYIADELVVKRDTVRQAAFGEILEAFKTRGIIATRLDIVNLDFNDDYERAVERKVKAVQEAAEAKNKTIQIEEEAKQKVLTAKAEAEAMRIKSQAISQNKGLVQYEAVQKWNGALPVNMYGSAPLPFINIKE